MQATGRGIAPPPDVGLLEAEHRQGHTAGDQRQAAVVHARRPMHGDWLRDHNQRQRDQRDGDVHPEDRPPGPLREIAPQDRADRGEAAGDAEEDRQRPATFAQLEGLHDDRQRGREHDRPARALHDSERHDPGLARACPSGSTRTSPRLPRTRSRRASPSCGARPCPPGAHRRRTARPATAGRR